MNEPADELAGEAGDLGRSRMGRFVVRCERIVIRCEEVFFTLILGALLLAGLLPIVCRLLELPGINWSSPLSHQLVLWVALFGAGAATRDRKHISIDAVGHALPGRFRLALRAATELLACVVCGLLVPIAITFVRDEASFTEGQTAFFGLPRSWLPAVIPVGLGLLAGRFFLAALFDAIASLDRSRGHSLV